MAFTTSSPRKSPFPFRRAALGFLLVSACQTGTEHHVVADTTATFSTVRFVAKGDNRDQPVFEGCDSCTRIGATFETALAELLIDEGPFEAGDALEVRYFGRVKHISGIQCQTDFDVDLMGGSKLIARFTATGEAVLCRQAMRASAKQAAKVILPLYGPSED